MFTVFLNEPVKRTFNEALKQPIIYEMLSMMQYKKLVL